MIGHADWRPAAIGSFEGEGAGAVGVSRHSSALDSC
jgi:hypothetical protein